MGGRWHSLKTESKVQNLYEAKGRVYSEFVNNSDPLWKPGAMAPDWMWGEVLQTQEETRHLLVTQGDTE